MTVVVCVKASGIIMALQYAAVFTFTLVAIAVSIIQHHKPFASKPTLNKHNPGRSECTLLAFRKLEDTR